ncbi:MAG: tetratricopeptide repeat protein [Elusimicrobia bacterium]|nr:tetratricopeptide repeat protein [Elusimicrobiota bacterium]
MFTLCILLVLQFTLTPIISGWGFTACNTRPKEQAKQKTAIDSQKITNLMQSGDYKALKELLNEYISLHPKNGLLYFYRAKAHLESGNFNDALKDLDMVLKLGFPEGSAYALKAVIHGRHFGDLKKQIEFSSKAVLEDSTDADAYFLRAEAYIKLREYEKALIDYNSLTALEPRNPDFYIDRADINYRMKNYRAALADAAKTLNLDSRKDIAHYISGKIHLDTGNFSKALESFNSALSIKPLSAHYYIARSQAYEKAGNFYSAIDDMELALTSTEISSDSVHYYALAKNFFRVNEQDKAVSALEKAMKSEAGRPEYYDLRGRIRAETGDYKSAAKDWEKMAELDPSKKEIRDRNINKLKEFIKE